MPYDILEPETETKGYDVLEPEVTAEPKPKPNTDWMKVGGMGPTPPIGTPLMGSVPIASPSEYGESEAAQQSVIPILNPLEVPSGEQIKRQFPLIPMPAAVASSALAKGAAGIGQFLTSPKGIQQAVTAATPVVGIAQRLKWVYDMAKSGGEVAGDLSARIEKAIQSPSDVTTEDWQGMAEDAVNTAITLAGAGKLSSAEAARVTGIRAPLGRVVESEKTRMAKDLAAQLEAEAKKAKIPTKYPTAERRVGVGPIPVGELQQEPQIPALADAALNEAMQLVKIPGKEQEALNALRAAVQGRIEPAGRRLVAEPVPASPLLGAERSVGALRSAEDLLAERRQPALEPSVEPAPESAPSPTVAPKLEPIDLTAELDFLAPRGPLEASKRAEVMRKLQERKQALEDAAKAEQALRQLVNAPEPMPPNPAQIPPPSIDLRQLEATMRRNAIPDISQKTGAKPATVEKAVKIEEHDHPWTKRIPGAAEQIVLEEIQLDKNAYKGEKAPTQPKAESPTKGIITGRAIEKWADDQLRGGATHAGPDVFAAYLVKGAALIERGIINFAEWSARMIAEHGDAIKPHLAALYDAAKGTIARAPIEASGTLKSAREIVEQRLAASAAPEQPKPATAAPQPKKPSAVTLDDVYDIFKPEKKEKISVPKVASGVVEGIRTGFSSKFRPTNKWVEDIAKQYGVKPQDVAGIMEQLKGSSGKGEAEIYRFNRDVSSLVKGNEKDFNPYMFLRRALDRLRMDERDINAALEGGEVKQLNRRQVGEYTIPELEAKLTALQQQLGPEVVSRFEKAADLYQKYMDDALRLQVESGRMSKDVYDAIKRDNQFYAPFFLTKYFEEGVKPEGTGAKIDTVADYTKAMKGIKEARFKLGDMLAAARRSILLSRILADKANAMRLVADWAAVDKDHVFSKQLGPDEPAPGNWQKVNVFLDGRKVQYAVPPEVAEAVQLFNGNAGGIVSQVLRVMSIPFKAGATALNVPFQISNLMADVPRQALVSKYGIRGVSDLVRYPLDLVHALYSSMAGDFLGKDNKLFLDFLDSGAAATTVQEHLTPEALKYRDPSTMTKAQRVGMSIINFMPEFSQAIEQTSKILGVKRAMRIEGVKSGAELAKKIPEAITEIRRFSGSPDFGRQGRFVEQARLNLLYMFLNARIQGTIADIGRLTGRDGAKTAATTWFRVGTAIGIPTAYLYYLNNLPEFKKDFDGRPQKEKDNYWLIPKSSFIMNEDGEIIRDYWRIPKRESSKWIANMVESGMRFAQQKDAKAFANFGQQMIEDISPINIQGNTGQERIESAASGLNPVFKAPIELATGRDLYRHRQLMPDTMKKASPELQFTDRTAEAFKKLAVAMPDVAPEFLRSPILLENITRNLTAGLLTQFLSRKPVKGREGIENAALLQRFQAIPYTENQAFTKQIQQLEREGADEYLTRQRQATKILDENEGKQLWEMTTQAKGDPKLIQKVVDLWVSKQNGATFQDRQLIALPPKQRAEYVAKLIAPMTPEQKQQAILDMAKKRILTEQVFVEMSQLPKQ